MKVKAEYIWIDGYEPTAGLRSKTKVLDNAVASVQSYLLGALMVQAHYKQMVVIATVC